VQEAFVRACAAGPRFTRVDNPEARLRTTAVNLHRNRWRKGRNFARSKHRLAGEARDELAGFVASVVFVQPE
jgi:RNA polymerase sigma-70 factor (ECF subfamily)